MHPDLKDASVSLSDAHRAMLQTGSAIQTGVIKGRGYYTATLQEHLMALGWRKDTAKKLLPGLVTPLHTVEGKMVCQVRPDEPKDPKQKYVGLRGQTSVLDIHPFALAAVKGGDFELWFVEGVKKADAGLSHRLCCVGLQGVFNWRNENGPLSDWEYIPLKGRSVVIAFDSDAWRNPMVYQGVKRFRQFLIGKGAKVRLLVLPDLPDGKKQGLDDFFANGGTVDGLKALIQDDLPALPDDAYSPTATPTIAAAILEEHNYARDEGGSLWVYEEGAYRFHGDQHIERQVKDYFTAKGIGDQWSSHAASEVKHYIGIDAPNLWSKPPADVVNLLNGLLDVRTRQLLPHSPDHLSPFQLPVRFDPAAKCPHWDRFIETTFPEDAQELPFELAAWIMTPDTGIQKAVLLIGEGSNGKSTFLAALTAFLGPRNVAGLSLQKLEEDRFALSRLVGKLANICPDLPAKGMETTSTFKALTGTEAQLTVERKFQGSFETDIYARLLFSANQPPRSKDATHAFFRRWLVVPFGRTYEAGTSFLPIPRSMLDAQLADPAELSGVLNRALQVLPRLRQQGFTETESMRAAWNEFRSETDPFAVWLDANTVSDPDAVTPRQALQDIYRDYCRENGINTMTPTAFGSAIRRLRGAIRPVQRTINGIPKVWCWEGIALKEDAPNIGQASRQGAGRPSHPSQSSQSSPYLIHRTTSDCLESDTDCDLGGKDRRNPVNSVNSVPPSLPSDPPGSGAPKGVQRGWK